ncbi:RhuM family protein [Eggerthellaceae bacterium 24-137]
MSDIEIYESLDGDIRLNVQLEDETVWLTQAQIAQLFGVNSQAITKHLGNIYEEGELAADATCSKMEQVRQEGGRQVKRTVNVYNLDAIISVGYRVNSRKATHFRQWATRILKEYAVKGFALDDRRLEG